MHFKSIQLLRCGSSFRVRHAGDGAECRLRAYQHQRHHR